MLGTFFGLASAASLLQQFNEFCQPESNLFRNTSSALHIHL